MSFNNQEVNAETKNAALRFEENLAKYPIEEQIAVGLISKNILNGCSWEFVRSNPEIKRNIKAFNASPNCSVQEVTYNKKANITGYLVYMKMDYMLQLLSKEAPGLITQKDLSIASKHREEACVNLSKLMMKGYKGRIGIYCTNDSQTITVDGHQYPAYAVSLREMLQIAVKFGYGVVTSQGIMPPQEVIKREDSVLKSLTVAPSSNALFINIDKMR